jgi:ribonuclease J
MAPSSRWPTWKASWKSTGLLEDAELQRDAPGERFKIGPFTINPIHVTHSLVDCVALAIHTPLGV